MQENYYHQILPLLITSPVGLREKEKNRTRVEEAIHYSDAAICKKSDLIEDRSIS